MRCILLFCLLYILLICASALGSQVHSISLASAGTSSTCGDNWSFHPAVSSDGRFVAFVSYADDLVFGVTCPGQVYIYDCVKKSLELISIGLYGVPGNGVSTECSVSGDGRYVAFSSDATNLVSGVEEPGHVYVRDRVLQRTLVVSVNANGVPGDDWSFSPCISSDGGTVVFVSQSTNLAAGVTDGTDQIYVKSMSTGEVSLASIGIDGFPADDLCGEPQISADGHWVVYVSEASNLVSGAESSGYQIYLQNLSSGSIQMVSVGTDGSPGDAGSFRPSINEDGSIVAFESNSRNLVEGKSGGTYVRDVRAGRNASIAESSQHPSLSADGRFVAYVSMSTSSKADVPDESWQIHLYDRSIPRDIVVSQDASGAEGNYASASPVVSSRGEFVAFESTATNLASGTIGDWQVLVADCGRLSCLAGVASSGGVYYTTDLNGWMGVCGQLEKIAVGDLTGMKAYQFAGLASDGSVWYSLDRNSWARIPGRLSDLVLGDVNGDGKDDIVGIASDYTIWVCTDLKTWIKVPGRLMSIAVGNFSTSGTERIAGLAPDNTVWVGDLAGNWRRVPGHFASIVAADFEGNGKYGLAGIDQAGSVWYTIDLVNWRNVPGKLKQLVAGDFDGNGKTDLAGIAANGTIWCSTDLSTWGQIPGVLNSMCACDMDRTGFEDLAGLDATGHVWYTTDLMNWKNIPGSLSYLSSGD